MNFCSSCFTQHKHWLGKEDRANSTNVLRPRYSLAEHDWGRDLLAVFSEFLHTLTLIDMAAIAPLYPFRNVVLLTDWGFGSVNHIMKLKGHVISVQTNHRKRIEGLKKVLFRFDLHERWFVVFCGKEEYFKINSILNHGDNFCGLFQCDIRNCVN